MPLFEILEMFWFKSLANEPSEGWLSLIKTLLVPGSFESSRSEADFVFKFEFEALNPASYEGECSIDLSLKL